MTTVKIIRRIGSSPQQRGSLSGETCPDIFELSDGNFAVIGKKATAEVAPLLPSDAAMDLHEEVVIIPRQLLIDARPDIPAE